MRGMETFIDIEENTTFNHSLKTNEKRESERYVEVTVERLSTVNSEIFTRILFSRNFAHAKFRKNKTLAKWQNHIVVY